MSKFNYFIDVSAFQDSTTDFFDRMKNHGAAGVTVKLTEGSADGSAYSNPKAGEQLSNAASAGLAVATYHFFRGYGYHDSVNEAKWYLKYLQAHHVDKSRPVICDVEVPLRRFTALSSDVNAFADTLADAGYKNFFLYTYTGYAGTNMYLSQIKGHLWVASYPTTNAVTSPATAYEPKLNHSAWQYSDNWYGEHVDCSIDLTGAFTRQPKNSHVDDTNYYTWNPKLIIARVNGAGVYSDVELNHKVKSVDAGTCFDTGKIVKSAAGTPRIQLTNGRYISARDDIWKNGYYMDNPKRVKVISRHGIYVYNSPDDIMSGHHRVAWFGRGTEFVINKTERASNNVSTLRTQSGKYITANKLYVEIV